MSHTNRMSYAQRRAHKQAWTEVSELSRVLALSGLAVLVLACGFMAAYCGFIVGGSIPNAQDAQALSFSLWALPLAACAAALGEWGHFAAKLNALRYP